MAPHNPSSWSDDGQLSVAEPIAADPAEATMRYDQLQEQLKSSERLNEYYNAVVAELRASLEQIEAEEEQIEAEEQAS
jgi:flagellar motility protein MotE (MotC chaperone)